MFQLCKPILLIHPFQNRRFFYGKSCFSYNKSTRTKVPCALQTKLLLIINYFFSFVCSTSFANAVSKFHFTAVWAFYHTRNIQFKVSATFSFCGFRSSSKRYSHFQHLLKEYKESIKKPGYVSLLFSLIVIIKKLSKSS